MADAATSPSTPATPAASDSAAPATPVTPTEPAASAPPVTPAEGQAAPTDAEPKPEVPKEDPKFAARFGALSKREREIQRREAEVKELADLRELAKTDPFAAAEKLGVTYDQWTARLYEQAQKELVDQTPEEIARKAAADEIERREKAQQDAQQKAAQEAGERAKAKFLDDAVQVATPDKAPHVAKMAKVIGAGAFQAQVWEVGEAWYEAKGEILSPQQIVEKIEAQLAAEFAPPAPKPAPAAAPTPAPMPSRAPTLSSRGAGDASPPQPEKRKVLSREESLVEAARIYRETVAKRTGASA